MVGSRRRRAFPVPAERAGKLCGRRWGAWTRRVGLWGHLPDSGWFGLLWVTGVSLSQSVSRPGLELPVRAFGKLCVSVCVCVSDLWTSLKFVCGSLYSHPPPSRGGVCVCVCTPSFAAPLLPACCEHLRLPNVVIMKKSP